MNTILSELWNGNLCPISACGYGDREMGQLAELMEKNSTRLQQSLSAQQAKVFENYVGCCEEYQLLLTEAAFAQGFAVATRLLCQALGTSYSSE